MRPQLTKLAGLALIAAVPLLMGMGNLGGSETAPASPKEEHAATITDSLEVATDIRNVSIDGAVILTGTRGKAVYSVPFKLIDEVNITPNAEKSGPDVDATIIFLSGKEIKMKVKKHLTLYAKTEFGDVRIRVSDMKKLKFSKRP
jgi:hypothetical protein